MRPSAPLAPQPWDAAAAGWDRHAASIRRWLADASPRMLNAARIEPGAKVLDLAAGTGDQTLDIVGRVGAAGEVWASDISEGVLALAQANLRDAAVARLCLHRADAQALGLAGQDFDAVVCRLGLMFCPSPLRALREVRRALRIGGRFSALVFSHADANPCIAIMMRIARQRAGLPNGDPSAPGSLLSLGRPGHLASLMREAGFGDVRVESVSAPFRLARCADYIEFVRTSGSPILELMRSLPASAQAAAWAEISRELERFSTPQGWEGPNELLLCAGANPMRGA